MDFNANRGPGMITQCPHCRGRFMADDALAGQEAACPTCRTSFTLAPVVMQSAVLRSRGRPPVARGTGSLAFLVIGGLILLGSIGAPWWQISITVHKSGFEDTLSEEDAKEMNYQAADADAEEREHREFFARHRLARKRRGALKAFRKRHHLDDLKALSPRRVKEIEDRVDGEIIRVFLWGWETDAGILGAAFGGVILLWGILTLSVGVLQRWSWTGSLACFGLAVPMGILGLMWIFTTPQATVMYMGGMGPSIGSYTVLLGAVVVVIAALVDVISGLVRLATSRR